MVIEKNWFVDLEILHHSGKPTPFICLQHVLLNLKKPCLIETLRKWYLSFKSWMYSALLNDKWMFMGALDGLFPSFFCHMVGISASALWMQESLAFLSSKGTRHIPSFTALSLPLVLDHSRLFPVVGDWEETSASFSFSSHFSATFLFGHLPPSFFFVALGYLFARLHLIFSSSLPLAS